MSLIKKPNEITCKSNLTCMIYGQPGIGKTTLACSAPSPVLLDYDGGVSRINGAHQVDTVQISSWEDTEKALTEIKEAGCYKTIIIDTVGKMLSYMDEFIMRNNPRMKKSDGALSLQGYGMRKAMFKRLISKVSIIGMNIIFVAHDKEDKHGEDVVVRPEVSGSAYQDLMKELDLVGYMMAYGKDRTITFDPDERFYTKNSCNLHGVIRIPVVVDEKGEPTNENNFMCYVVVDYINRQLINNARAGEYIALLNDINAKVNAIENADDANDFVKWYNSIEHIWQSKQKAEQAIAAKAKAIGIKFNKSTSSYE